MIHRRHFLHTAGAGALALPFAAGAAPRSPADFRFGLNMSTIRGCAGDLDIADEVDVAGKAGYDAIEPWLRKLHAYTEAGGKLADLRQRIEDHGLTVESAIGFARWIVDDDAQRAKGFEDAKRDMDALAKIGAVRMAAPPAGAPRDKPVALDAAAERYDDLLELGVSMGVIPQVEMWGGNSSIGTLSRAIYVAARSGHPRACFLGDVYHIYKGGSDFAGLKLLGPQALQTFHMNDYPADPPRETIRDGDRVWPGDGIAPLDSILQGFLDVGAAPVLSLELFNKDYWARPAAEVAATGLAKMKAAVARLNP